MAKSESLNHLPDAGCQGAAAQAVERTVKTNQLLGAAMIEGDIFRQKTYLATGRGISKGLT